MLVYNCIHAQIFNTHTQCLYTIVYMHKYLIHIMLVYNCIHAQIFNTHTQCLYTIVYMHKYLIHILNACIQLYTCTNI